MGKASPALVNFNGGELGPLLAGRVDYEKFPSSCHKMERFIPTVQGPAKRCPGTRHVIPVKDSSKRVWLIRFEFSYDQAYILEFGDLYVRFHTDRGTQLEASQNITGITQPAGVVTIVGHGYSNGQWLYLTGIGGMTELNGRYIVVSDAAADTFRMKDFDGNYITTGGYTAYTSGGTVARVYTVTSPYALADLTNGEGGCALSVTQSGDVLYIACDGYQPRTLTRSGAVSWAFATYDPSDGPFQAESAAAAQFDTNGVTGSVTINSSVAIFEAAHVGMLFRIDLLNFTKPPWEASKAVVATDERRSDGKTYEAGNNATTGTVRPIHERGEQSDGTVDWEYKHPGYVIFRITARTDTTTVTATVLGPGEVPSEINGAAPGIECHYRFGSWGTATGAEWPHKVCFFRDRLWWAGEQNIYASVAGDYASHAIDTQGEVLSDNGINLTMSVGTVDKIRWLKPSDALLVGTAGGEIAVREVTTTDPLGPDNVKFELQSAEGSREVTPVQVEDGVLFVRIGGRRVVEQRYDIQADAWVPREMNVLYPEVTRSGIIDIAYQKEPDDIVWAVLANGGLIGMTYDREQNVFGWHRHPIAGSFGTGDAVVEAVQVLTGPDGDVEDVWLVVKRTVDGATRRYIEYFAQAIEEGDDVQGAVYLDSSLEFDGAVAATLTPGAGATVAGTEGVTFTAGSSVFVAGDVGREIRVRYYDEDDEIWRTSRAEITGYSSGTVVTATIVAAFTSLTAIASGGWRMTSTTIGGLWHLEGQTVSALADGQEVPDLTVTDGEITLPDAAARAQVGLPYTSTLATQRLEAGAADGTAQGKTKRIHKFVLRLYATLGGKVGSNEDTLDLIQYRRGSDLMDEVPPLVTGDTEALAFDGGYETDGRVWIVCDQPLPFTLVAVYPQVVTQDR